MKNNINNKIESAKAGRKSWIELNKRYKLKNDDYVIIMPHENSNYNRLAVAYLDQFIYKKRASSIFVLTYDNWVIQQNNMLSKNVKVIKYSNIEIENIVQFYCLYEFTTNIVIISLDLPTGRKGKGLIEKKEMTLEDIFLGVVYGIFI